MKTAYQQAYDKTVKDMTVAKKLTDKPKARMLKQQIDEIEKRLYHIEDKLERLLNFLEVPLAPGCYYYDDFSAGEDSWDSLFKEPINMNVLGKAKSELVSVLKSNIVDIVFEKKDGSERKMTCTLVPELIDYESAGKSVESDTLVTVWDLDSEGWRRFNIEKLRSFETFDEG